MNDTTASEPSIGVHEELLLNLAKEKPEGISNDDIKSAIPDLPLSQIASLINICLKAGSLELFKSRNKLLYKYKETSECNVKVSDNEEKLLYKIVEEAGNKGVWIRDIRQKSNLTMTQLNKVLKNLETKKIIKAVKSVSASKKKVYMLYELDPDSSITGGAWYQDQDFESEFVDVLNQQCTRFLVQRVEEAKKQVNLSPIEIRNRSYATAKSVHEFIQKLGISTIPLSTEDIEMILYTVVLDNHAERIVAANGSYLYRATKPYVGSTGLVQTTCGVCPIASRCTENGAVNPTTCVYLNEWLEQTE